MLSRYYLENQYYDRYEIWRSLVYLNYLYLNLFYLKIFNIFANEFIN